MYLRKWSWWEKWIPAVEMIKQVLVVQWWCGLVKISSTFTAPGSNLLAQRRSDTAHRKAFYLCWAISIAIQENKETKGVLYGELCWYVRSWIQGFLKYAQICLPHQFFFSILHCFFLNTVKMFLDMFEQKLVSAKVLWNVIFLFWIIWKVFSLDVLFW